MGIYAIRITNFFMDLFVKQQVPDVYAQIKYWNNKLILYKRKAGPVPHSQSNKPYSVALIPEYLHLEVAKELSLITKTYAQNNLGYAILLEEGFDIDAHLKTRFKSNYRNIKKKHQRLEACFNVSYKFFYGSIEKEEYQFLMNRLHAMLMRRFRQRKDKNEKLDEWEVLLANTYTQIIEKAASLFVIYDNEVPIDISLNYHFHKIMFGAVSSYDIDYYKFGLGAIEKIKILEWCLSNDYRILEFGYGDLEYKHTWSNYTYHFKYQVLFSRKSLSVMVLAKFELLKLRVKEYLKSKNIAVYFNRLKGMRYFGKGQKNFTDNAIPYDSTMVADAGAYGLLKTIYPVAESPFPLKAIVIDYLYATQEHKDHVVVQEVLGESNTFLISGENHIQKIKFKT